VIYGFGRFTGTPHPCGVIVFMCGTDQCLDVHWYQTNGNLKLRRESSRKCCHY